MSWKLIGNIVTLLVLNFRKDLSSWMVIGIIAGIGFCATFISFLRKVDNSTKNTVNRHRSLGGKLLKE